jgi:4-diphosphocytidyl-2C-methyl-D-erythritol kinase
MRNDLLAPFLAAYPGQERIYMDLRERMCKNLFLSGSGATFFSVFDSTSQARAAFLRLDEKLRPCAVRARSIP